MNNQDILNLKKRYLIWLYKTTKEELDKIERKFTQLEIDKFILKELEKEDKNRKVKRFIDEFKVYLENKEKQGLALKYENKELKPEYYFLTLKLKTIEKAIVKELGKDNLRKLKNYYEQEMRKRIIQERQEKI